MDTSRQQAGDAAATAATAATVSVQHQNGPPVSDSEDSLSGKEDAMEMMKTFIRANKKQTKRLERTVNQQTTNINMLSGEIRKLQSEVVTIKAELPQMVSDEVRKQLANSSTTAGGSVDDDDFVASYLVISGMGAFDNPKAADEGEVRQVLTQMVAGASSEESKALLARMFGLNSSMQPGRVDLNPRYQNHLSCKVFSAGQWSREDTEQILQVVRKSYATWKFKGTHLIRSSLERSPQEERHLGQLKSLMAELRMLIGQAGFSLSEIYPVKSLGRVIGSLEALPSRQLPALPKRTLGGLARDGQPFVDGFLCQWIGMSETEANRAVASIGR